MTCEPELQIGKLKFLTELQLYNNKLTALPTMLGHCSQLTLLHVGGNRVRRVYMVRRTGVLGRLTAPCGVVSAVSWVRSHQSCALR